jgi:hypothetical protein
MQGAYAGTRHGFLNAAKPYFDNYNFFAEKHTKALRMSFIDDYWNFLLKKTECFTFLQIVKKIAKIYSKFKISISFISLGGYFITTQYNKKIYKPIFRSFNKYSNKAVENSIRLEYSTNEINSIKQVNSLTANIIHNFDAVLFMRLHSKLNRKFSVPGVGFPIISIFDCLTVPTIFLKFITNLYRDVNYDVFYKKGKLQDLEEGFNNEFFSNQNSTLLDDFITYFIEDLTFKIGNIPADKNSPSGKDSISKLQTELVEIINNMKKSTKYTPFNFEALKKASFLKKS